MTNLKLILAGVFALALAGSHVFVWRQGGLEARKDAAEHKAELVEAERRFSVEAMKRAIVAEGKLAELLAQPPAAPQVRTAVRENPTACVVPKPVDDQLRRSRSEANADIRASLGSR